MTDITKSVELLSPVGDMERLSTAINFGADAVYLAGQEFGMRTSPSNFSQDELRKAVAFAHSKNVHVYLTCNTVPHNDELARLPEFLQFAQDVGVDAFIIADFGVMTMAKKYAPKVDIHMSTQAGIANYASANELYSMGVKRVVLARELNLSEIAEIRAKTPKELEIEVFVHGAMCVSFSGRCLLSSYLTGRDANRGDCAQPCRWEYALVESKRPGQYMPISEDQSGTYILNSKDMCMIEHIPELVKAGVNSLKIEGRAKSAYYVAVVTNAYRRAIDEYLQNPAGKVSPWVVEELNKISHREYSTGFYFGTEPG
ncbi:MAG: family peptidase, partial [Caproiciproducens sp.]|nr:family peptidase [Caproiciproducens sp.]